MRKKLRRKIAHQMQDQKKFESKAFRENRQNEEDLVEAETFKRGTHKVSAIKTGVDKQRVNNLLNRGIPSHFYKNLNKLA